MNPVKNNAERSHALPRELWPILALIFTGPVLFVNVLLGGDRALQRAWIIALIGLACFGFLGRSEERRVGKECRCRRGRSSYSYNQCRLVRGGRLLCGCWRGRGRIMC